jgi:hypothetical protein
MKKLIATTMSSVLTIGSFAVTFMPQANAANLTFRMDALSAPTTVPSQPKPESAQSQVQETQTALRIVPDVCTKYSWIPMATSIVTATIARQIN